ncbi:Metallo-dependent phosphatase [Anaeromyces robustus]|uniref:Metallo-dependent phosphatase n=1 Tax=Anaeromyces robustus TaxID=1754192 RepID=A0A1Y1XJ07_9FUNG|nr:Metallo-dependent phosphatase [Anaeromyces robustus]|eukprot:ORX85741.1 Metallo-dependent phosphatase [Anaeromyces robustus]
MKTLLILPLLCAFVKAATENSNSDSDEFYNGYDCWSWTVMETPEHYGYRWGREKNGAWCGMVDSIPSWNDREYFSLYKDEWKEFKVKWDTEYKFNFERVSIYPSEDESMLNFAWYTRTPTDSFIRVSQNEDMTDYTEFTGTSEYIRIYLGEKFYTNKVTIKGLNRKSTYYYQRKMNNKWETPVKLNTYDPENFKFLFVGDPQIGGSVTHVAYGMRRPLGIDDSTRNDAFNWNKTVSRALELTKEPSVLLSAGDQVDTMGHTLYQEIEYSAFFLPEPLKSLPVAAAVGNHEATVENFKNHFNVPNPYTTPENTEIVPGYSNFFKYNNVLVVVIESNYANPNDVTAVITNAVEKYPDVDWRIALFHHDIYSNGANHSHVDDEIKKLRPVLTKLFSKYQFDLVINGHDHIYSASKFISYDETKNDEVDSDGLFSGYSINEISNKETYINPKGTLFVTANCSSGSKHYPLLKEEVDYIHFSNQTYTTTFVDTFNLTDGPYIIEKTAKNITTTPTPVKPVTTTTTTTTTTTIPSTPTDTPSECWSLKKGFECCQPGAIIAFIDDDGKWGIENGKWCGIIEQPTEECWSLAEGYPCCEKSSSYNYTDKNGKKWGIENRNWCGIVEEKCWSEQYGFPCCQTTNKVISEDSFGKWGVENKSWCGITNTNIANTTTTTNKITTTTTTTTTTTKKTTTTTTKKTTTTTTTIVTPKPTECAGNWNTCGGQGYNGPTCCNSGYYCKEVNQYYSQCVPDGQ